MDDQNKTTNMGIYFYSNVSVSVKVMYAGM